MLLLFLKIFPSTAKQRLSVCRYFPQAESYVEISLYTPLLKLAPSFAYNMPPINSKFLFMAMDSCHNS